MKGLGTVLKDKWSVSGEIIKQTIRWYREEDSVGGQAQILDCGLFTLHPSLARVQSYPPYFIFPKPIFQRMFRDSNLWCHRNRVVHINPVVASNAIHECAHISV